MNIVGSEQWLNSVVLLALKFLLCVFQAALQMPRHVFSTIMDLLKTSVQINPNKNNNKSVI